VTERQTGGDVAIIGAGIIGLSIAFELASRGAFVRVYDTGAPARAASWAAAGMLAPFTERLPDEAMQTLCESSLALYPSFAQTLHNVSSVDPQLRLDGILHTAFTSAALEQLRDRAQTLAGSGHSATVLDRDQTLAAEPVLGKHVAGALLVHGEGQIDNRRLGRALLAACELRGVRLHTGLENVEIECDARRVLGVRTNIGYVPAAAVVNAAGAWSSLIPGVPASCVPPVEPVKGQMLAIEIPKALMRRTTWIPGGYLVPRADGRLLVGATMEHAGYDVRITAGGLSALLSAVLTAAPALRDFAVSESWAGLRPSSPDERPFLGPTELDGYYLATGHYRNGILLAPATARLLADALERGAVEALAPFSLGRFGTKVASS
jgi:glycine oxidase